ncbi:MAG: aldo/keto reductase [Armatimonadota bacterium]|nr:aldo/keto reductase [Armatimonadota bacterium]
MRYRRLGRSGLKVSVLGLGCNTFGRFADADQTARIVHAALDLGVNFFDTADVYSQGVSEEFLGRALGSRRGRAVVATKVVGAMGDGPNDRGASRAHITDGVHASLRRLGTDHIDLLQLHNWDPETPLEESLEALNDLVRAGKVRYVGCSNYTAWQLVWALWISDRRGWASFVSVQPEYSLLARGVEADLLPACVAFGVGVIPYFPLAAGMLTGKYREGEPAPPGTRGYESPRFQQRFATPRNFAIVRRLEAWARERGHSVAELAIAWLLARPAVSTVITGTTRPEQVEANVRATAWELTPSEVEEVASLAPVDGGGRA